MARGKKKEKILTPEEKLQEALVPESEWPYKVPENWCWTRLSSLISASKEKTEDFSDKEVKYIGLENIEKDYGIVSYNSSEGIKSLKSVFHEGQILYGKLRPYLNKHDIAPFSGVCSTDILVFDTKETISNQFVDYFLNLQSFIEYAVANSKGINLPRVSESVVLEALCPLPPLPEQQRIVDRIESLFAKLDEAKEKAQAVVNGFDKRRTMILHKAFIGELTTNWRRVHNISMASWEQLTLDDVAEYKKGPFGSSITKAMFVPKGKHTYKVYEQGNAIRKTLEYGHYYISEQKYNELKSFAVQGGDIIISCAGTIGEVYKLPEECEAGVINQALMRVRLRSIIDERFFRYYFGEVIKGDVIDKANGTAIKNIPPFKVLKAMEIQLPSLNEHFI